jgi:hypothetical protein
VEKSNIPETHKISTSAIKGQANDDFCFKQMMIFAYDHRGTIMADRVPCGTSVTAAYCRNWVQKLRRKMHKTDLTCSGMGHSSCTMHART